MERQLIPCGVCDHCAEPILLPRDAVVAVDQLTFHRGCHEQRLVARARQQINDASFVPRRNATVRLTAEPATSSPTG